MKSLMGLLIAFSVALPASAARDQKSIQLADVVKRVSERNYKVQENALKVYQAKANIEVARGNLLPKLNLWMIVGAVVDPTSLWDRIPDIAPFLVPANWFRLRENELLYLSEKEGYRALWGNEVYTAKALYLQTLLDQRLLSHVQTSVNDLERVYRIVQTREVFGGVAPGTARDIEIRMLGLREDQQNLKILVEREKSELSYALGYSADAQLTLSSVNLPDFGDLKPINTSAYEFRVLSISPERRQFDHFLSVLSQVKNEIKFNFLGVSSMSRGAAGGVFDSLPIPNGLGFGNASAAKIVDAQKEIVLTQKRGVEETIRRQLMAISTQYNSDLYNYAGYQRRLTLARESKDAILRRIQLGENVDVLQLSEVSKGQIQAEAAIYTVQFRNLTLRDRLNRMLFTGDYAMQPSLITSIKGGRP